MSNGGPPNAVGGDKQPPNGGTLERRVSALEVRLDVVLPTLVTKGDLAELRAELRTELHVQLERLRAEFGEQNGKLQTELHVSQEKLRAELHVGHEELQTELQVSQEKLRTELQVSQEKWRTALQVSQEKLRAELQVSQEKLLREFERLSSRLLRWMIATTLSLVITVVGFGNILISRLAPQAAPGSSESLNKSLAKTVPGDAQATLRIASKK